MFNFKSGATLIYGPRIMSGNVWNLPLEIVMVDMGISSNIMKSPSPKCYMKFWDMTMPSIVQTYTNLHLPNYTLLPILT